MLIVLCGKNTFLADSQIKELGQGSGPVLKTLTKQSSAVSASNSHHKKGFGGLQVANLGSETLALMEFFC